MKKALRLEPLLGAVELDGDPLRAQLRGEPRRRDDRPRADRHHKDVD